MAVTTEPTALGRALAQVHSGVVGREGEGGYFTTYARETARAREGAGSGGSGGGSGTPGRPAPPAPARGAEASAQEGSEAVTALGAWESAHEGLLQDPSNWPKRKLRDKLRESGVAHLLGLGDAAALDGASKQALLSAFGRIAATRRMQEIYAGGKGWARGSK